MPKGVYEKDYLYRKTAKLKEGIALLRAHDRDFKLQPLMTNDEVYIKLHDLGFKYADSMWFKPRSNNGHTPEPISTEVPPAEANYLEVVLQEGDLSKVQEVISAMKTLGFQVEVWVTGQKG